MRFRTPATRAWWVAVVSLLLGAVSGASPQGPERGLDLHYDVYYSVVKLLTVESSSRVAPDTYSLRSTMETVGPLGLIFPWTYRSEVQGRIEGVRLAPGTFHSRSEIRGRVQLVDLHYQDGNPVVSTLEPFAENVLGHDFSREDVPPELRTGTIDPLTEIAALTQELARGETCAGTQRVFDGFRRYDVVYEDLGERELEASSRDAYRGTARLCRSRIQPIAGFWKSTKEQTESVTGITAWLMPPRPGSAPVPVRLEIEGSRGSLQVHLASAVVPPDPAR